MHDWITIHRLRFPEPVSSFERIFPPVAGPDCWLFGPHYDVGPDGMLTGVSDIWGGVGIWQSREAAERMVAAPGDVMPWLGEAVAAWHCLGVPISHRGTVNWRGHLEDGEAVRPAPVDPGGPLIVLTSAGFASRDPETLPRIKRFVAGVVEVLGAFVHAASRDPKLGRLVHLDRPQPPPLQVTDPRLRKGTRLDHPNPSPSGAHDFDGSSSRARPGLDSASPVRPGSSPRASCRWVYAGPGKHLEVGALACTSEPVPCGPHPPGIQSRPVVQRLDEAAPRSGAA